VELDEGAVLGNGDTREGGLREDGASVEGRGREGLDGDAGVGVTVEEGVVEGGWTAQALQGEC